MTERAETDTTAERNPEIKPAVYVASLSDYNAGHLHGAWIDAAQEPDDLHAEVQAMLRRSPSKGAEEWAIHDYDAFGPLHLSEYEPLETVSRIALGIKEHGPAFAAWASQLDALDPETLDRFDDSYQGTWDSLEEYAADLLDSMGYNLDALGPAELAPYVRFDLDAYARDLAAELIVVETHDGRTHLFLPE